MANFKRIKKIKGLSHVIKAGVKKTANYYNTSMSTALKGIIKVKKGKLQLAGRNRTIYEIEGPKGLEIHFRNAQGHWTIANGWDEFSEKYWS